MAINIKSPAVCTLIQEAADLAGISQVSVVEEAMRGYLNQLRLDTRRTRALDLLADVDRALTDGDRAAIRADLADLYDDDGLPA